MQDRQPWPSDNMKSKTRSNSCSPTTIHTTHSKANSTSKVAAVVKKTMHRIGLSRQPSHVNDVKMMETKGEKMANNWSSSVESLKSEYSKPMKTKSKGMKNAGSCDVAKTPKSTRWKLKKLLKSRSEVQVVRRPSLNELKPPPVLSDYPLGRHAHPCLSEKCQSTLDESCISSEFYTTESMETSPFLLDPLVTIRGLVPIAVQPSHSSEMFPPPLSHSLSFSSFTDDRFSGKRLRKKSMANFMAPIQTKNLSASSSKLSSSSSTSSLKSFNSMKNSYSAADISSATLSTPRLVSPIRTSQRLARFSIGNYFTDMGYGLFKRTGNACKCNNCLTSKQGHRRSTSLSAESHSTLTPNQDSASPLSATSIYTLTDRKSFSKTSFSSGLFPPSPKHYSSMGNIARTTSNEDIHSHKQEAYLPLSSKSLDGLALETHVKSKRGERSQSVDVHFAKLFSRSFEKDSILRSRKGSYKPNHVTIKQNEDASVDSATALLSDLSLPTFPRQVKETFVIYDKQDGPHTLVYPTGAAEHIAGKVNQYYILREIGCGGFGKVLLCQHEVNHRFYACKIISKSRIRKKNRFVGGPMHQQGGLKREGNEKSESPRHNVSFDNDLVSIKREIAIFKKISHPNINALVEVLDDVKDDNLYMIFELCEFGPMMKIKVNEVVTPYSEDLARKWFRDILLGLEYLHHKRIFHRDIKPENLLLTARGTVQIADFGISYMMEDWEGESDVIDNNNSSPLFSPPEAFQAHNKQINGKAQDIWSLGVTLYCLLHGKCPFEDTQLLNLCHKIMNDDIVMSDTLSNEAKDVIKKMLMKNPEERITLAQLKVHPWVDCYGKAPMMSKEENCKLATESYRVSTPRASTVTQSTTKIEVDVTEEELENAFKPAEILTIMSKVLSNIFKTKRRTQVRRFE